MAPVYKTNVAVTREEYETVLRDETTLDPLRTLAPRCTVSKAEFTSKEMVDMRFHNIYEDWTKEFPCPPPVGIQLPGKLLSYLHVNVSYESGIRH